LNINTLAISYASKYPKTGLILCKILAFEREKLQLGLTSKTLAITILPSTWIFSHSLGVFNYNQYVIVAILQSCLHEQWSWKYASTLESRIRYTPSVCFETFPFLSQLPTDKEIRLELVGKNYYLLRSDLMRDMRLGLTKIYNHFHNPNINLLDEENGIQYLRNLQIELDSIVLDTYGWNDLNLRHDFYEVDYLPENDRIRFTIHPETRKEILKRLLLLNHKLHKEEQIDTSSKKEKRSKINIHKSLFSDSE
jgi:hypothetical protein